MEIQPINWSAVRFVDPEFIGRPTVADVQRAVCQYAGITRAELRGRRRERRYVRPRGVAMLLAREMTGQSLPQIARAFGGRNHTTVLLVNRNLQCRLSGDPKLAAKINEVRNIIIDGLISRAGRAVQ